MKISTDNRATFGTQCNTPKNIGEREGEESGGED